MDVLSLIGLILAFVAIVGGNFLEGGHVGALVNGPAALIVLGGTLAAALLQSPLSSFKRALQILRWILFPPRVDLAGGIDRVVNWSLTARKEGLLGLEGWRMPSLTRMRARACNCWWTAPSRKLSAASLKLTF